MKDWKAEHDKVLGQMKELRADRDFYKDQYFRLQESGAEIKDALKDLILKVLDR